MSRRDEKRYQQRAADLDQYAASGGNVAARLAAEKAARDNELAQRIADQMAAEREDDF